jgi:hypothetical protein
MVNSDGETTGPAWPASGRTTALTRSVSTIERIPEQYEVAAERVYSISKEERLRAGAYNRTAVKRALIVLLVLATPVLAQTRRRSVRPGDAVPVFTFDAGFPR